MQPSLLAPLMWKVKNSETEGCSKGRTTCLRIPRDRHPFLKKLVSHMWRERDRGTQFSSGPKSSFAKTKEAAMQARRTGVSRPTAVTHPLIGNRRLRKLEV